MTDRPAPGHEQEWQALRERRRFMGPAPIPRWWERFVPAWWVRCPSDDELRRHGEFIAHVRAARERDRQNRA